jgi:hypothetical protein
MKVEYLFSRNKKMGSKLIAWASSFEDVGLQDNPSHIAVLVDCTWVFESTLTSGVRVVPYKQWKQINEELYRIPCIVNIRDSGETLSKAAELWNMKYDWFGVLFFAWRYLGLILLNKPLPQKNRWEDENKYFCTEFIAKLTNENYSMKSPARICAKWLGETDATENRD